MFILTMVLRAYDMNIIAWNHFRSFFFFKATFVTAPFSILDYTCKGMSFFWKLVPFHAVTHGMEIVR